MHTAVTTPANVADIVEAKDCAGESDEEACMDAGYVGTGKRPEATEPDGPLHGKQPFVAAKKSTARTEEQKFREHAISQVRSTVEHPFHYLKDILGTRKTRYRGIKKNDSMLCTRFALVDLLMADRARARACAAA